MSLAAAFAIAALGGLATASSVDTWYAGLEKPGFNPPNGVFAPVWTSLHALMALAAWRVWRASTGMARRRALGLYAAQLALNLGWSVLFFGCANPAGVGGDRRALRADPGDDARLLADRPRRRCDDDPLRRLSGLRRRA